MPKSFVAITAVVVTVVMAAPASFAQKKDQHNDAFVRGTNDGAVAGRVRHQLLMLPYYGVFDDLAFSLNGSTVTLVGSVARPTLKSDAENAVKHVEGIQRVVNNIEVLPLSPMDDQVRVAEYRAIYGDSDLSTRYGFQALPSIHIIVKNGNVTLEGVVANQFDKNLINVRARAVPNAFKVTNNLQVEGS